MGKLIGITTIGTFWSPWLPYTLASIYGVCDNIVVVNAGLDMEDPDPEITTVPLEKASRVMKKLDVKGKIIEVKDFITQEILEHKAPVMTQFEANKWGLKNWFDPRGRNMTIASETAVKMGADMVLRIDSDQCCYADIAKLRGRKEALTLYQHEFCGDVYHLADPRPSSPFNDSVHFYPPSKGDWYVGGLAPVIKADRKPCYDVHCAHLRMCNPPGLSEREKYEHFYGRIWFRLWTNEGLWGERLREEAEAQARELLRRVGKPSNVPPPEVVLGNPKEYIEAGESHG